MARKPAAAKPAAKPADEKPADGWKPIGSAPKQAEPFAVRTKKGGNTEWARWDDEPRPGQKGGSFWVIGDGPTKAWARVPNLADGYDGWRPR